MPSCHHWVRAIRRADRPRPSWGPLLLYLPAENIQHRPLLMYPLTDFSTRPTGGPLLLYPLAEKALIPLPPGRKYSTSALIAIPFDRFFASGALVALPSGRKGPCRSTFWPKPTKTYQKLPKTIKNLPKPTKTNPWPSPPPQNIPKPTQTYQN